VCWNQTIPGSNSWGDAGIFTDNYKTGGNPIMTTIDRTVAPSIKITYCVQCDYAPQARELAAAIEARFGLAPVLEEGHRGIFEVSVDGDVIYNNFAHGGELPTDAQIFPQIRKVVEPITNGRSHKMRVMNPMGYPPQIQPISMAPRLDTLDGKTIYLVDARFDDSDRFLQQMQQWFNEHMPSTQTVFVSKAGVYTEDDPVLFAEIKAKGDAMIMAVGH
jgi:selT/selW/selH-like putative selenoprotein